uniref:Cytochrome c oxidase copper chaperone n=2 Tax=Solanum lycopersicum TaxID=4081 RepID=K4CGZ9_SOLLC
MEKRICGSVPIDVKRSKEFVHINLFINPLFSEKKKKKKKTNLKPSLRMGGASSQLGDGVSKENTSTTTSSSQLPKDEKLAPATVPADSKPKKKICCACPETKKVRDECIVEHGESACEKWIEAHLKCLRAEGFNV